MSVSRLPAAARENERLAVAERSGRVEDLLGALAPLARAQDGGRPAAPALLRNPEDLERRIRRKLNTGSGELEQPFR